MKASELKAKIYEGALLKYASLYSDTEAQKTRFIGLIDGFISLWGDSEAQLLSVPGRSEISGNHTDHNHGLVLVAAISCDILAAVKKTNNNTDKKSDYKEKTAYS